MSYDCPDFVGDATEMLALAGYTFHDRLATPEDEMPGATEVHWFCWSDGKKDIEVGEDCSGPLEATITAMQHWFHNTRIISCEEEALLEHTDIADVLSEARTRIDEAFQDAQHLDDTEAWREAALDTINKIDSILNPVAEAG